jgi:hypothetical protein
MMKSYYQDAYEGQSNGTSPPPPPPRPQVKPHFKKKTKAKKGGHKAEEELCAAHALLGLSPPVDHCGPSGGDDEDSSQQSNDFARAEKTAGAVGGTGGGRRRVEEEEEGKTAQEGQSPKTVVVVENAPASLHLPTLAGANRCGSGSSNSSSASTVTVPSSYDASSSLDGGANENRGWTVVCSSSAIHNNATTSSTNSPVPPMITESEMLREAGRKKKTNDAVLLLKDTLLVGTAPPSGSLFGKQQVRSDKRGFLMMPGGAMDPYDVMHIDKFPPPPPTTSASCSSLHFVTTTVLAAQPVAYYDGSISLHLPGDEESLSALHCFMRKYCVEAFSASAQDVATPRYGKSHGRSIVVGQVGIQCKHCKHRPYGQRQERAVCFPSSLKNIYHSIETWQRRHSLVCEDIPPWAKRAMTDLMGKSRSGAGGRRQYWEESARRLGLVDTDHGIRFVRPPGMALVPPRGASSCADAAAAAADAAPTPGIGRTSAAAAAGAPEAPTSAAAAAAPDGAASSSAVAADLVRPVDAALMAPHAAAARPSLPVVAEDDKLLVTEYLFTLLDQMETCYFAEQDRVGGRSKVKDCDLGYPGLQCKHCSGKAGFGRYFPVSLAALTSANSDRNIFNHIVKCRRCPVEVRENLQHLLQQQHVLKNRRGSRKLFFMKVWARMHYKKP